MRSMLQWVGRSCVLRSIIISLFFLTIYGVQNPAFASDASEEIKGVVVDSRTGKPLVGATVIIDGTDDGAITDARGRFTLKSYDDLFENTMLIVSYLGYKDQLISLGIEKENITIRMFESNMAIDALVVLGYQKQFKEKTTGNVVSIKSEEISKQPIISSPMEALQGRYAGVMVTQTSGVPGAPFEVIIRGRSSFNSETAPLYIIDGVPFDVSDIGYGNSGQISYIDPLSTLNPNDIESISVLKDADATAIYGTRGSNGVVIIVTKRGEAGPTKVSFNFDRGISMAHSNVEMLSTEDYLKMRTEAFAADNVEMTVGNAIDVLEWKHNHSTNWFEEVLGTPSQNYNLQFTASGGNSDTQFIFSSGVSNSSSIAFNTDSDKFMKVNGKLRLNHKSDNDRFRVDGTVSYNVLNSHSTGDVAYAYLNLAPNMPTRNEDGSVYWIPNDDGFDAPLSNLYDIGTTMMYTFLASMNLEYDFAEKFTFRLNSGYSNVFTDQSDKLLDGGLNPLLDYGYTNYNIVNNDKRTQYNVEPQLTYENTVAKELNLNVLAGATIESIDNKGAGIYFYDFPTAAMMDNHSAADRSSNNTSSLSQYRSTSLFLRAGLDYKDKYLLNINVRREGSTRFAPGSQFGNFWSVAGGWILSNENFAKNLKWLSFSKLRASYGLTGNDQIGDYNYLTTYNLSNHWHQGAAHTVYYEGVSGYAPASLGNNLYEWEEKRAFEVGLETALFNNTIYFETAFYLNRSNNQLVSYPVPSQSGFTSYQANLNALVENRGFEMSINTVNIRTNDFKWTTDINLTIPRNVVLEFPGLEGSAYDDTYKVGESLTVHNLLYTFDKIDPETGIPQFVDTSGDGLITTADRGFLPYDEDPDYYGGINNTFTYKGFELGVFFQYTNRPHVIGYQYAYPYPVGYGYDNVPTAMYEEAWTPDNPTATRPGLTAVSSSEAYSAYVYNYRLSDAMITTGSFLRLKNLNFSYTLPAVVAERMRLKSLRFYFSAQNLFTVTNYFGYDPETSYTAVPPLKSFVIGLNVTL